MKTEGVKELTDGAGVFCWPSARAPSPQCLSPSPPQEPLGNLGPKQAPSSHHLVAHISAMHQQETVRECERRQELMFICEQMELSAIMEES
ncbi:hypothetical protein JOQ06_009834 [Pogonophryne albipinna]|uniref:Uncharacterized protein n=1 Tax=Pogonophryne albipinna TaxID=1090488 RepID=A0AAD6BT11_9TELE|nr:hypothetical protein JOQ06_009834 [Pogonophryne albipinna]